jgi:YbgC/YbaW family acyl-CoA thioester hydrolase
VRGRTCVTRTRVRFGETDAAGIAFYPNFFAWFDVGASALMRAVAPPLLGPAGRPRWGIPIVESGARFSAPVRYDDEIAIHTTVVELGTSSMRLEHVVTCGDVEVARGFEVRVLVQFEGDGIASRPIPQELRASLTEGVTTQEVA